VSPRARSSSCTTGRVEPTTIEATLARHDHGRRLVGIEERPCGREAASAMAARAARRLGGCRDRPGRLGEPDSGGVPSATGSAPRTPRPGGPSSTIAGTRGRSASTSTCRIPAAPARPRPLDRTDRGARRRCRRTDQRAAARSPGRIRLSRAATIRSPDTSPSTLERGVGDWRECRADGSLRVRVSREAPTALPTAPRAPASGAAPCAPRHGHRMSAGCRGAPARGWRDNRGRTRTATPRPPRQADQLTADGVGGPSGR